MSAAHDARRSRWKLINWDSLGLVSRERVSVDCLLSVARYRRGRKFSGPFARYWPSALENRDRDSRPLKESARSKSDATPPGRTCCAPRRRLGLTCPSNAVAATTKTKTRTRTSNKDHRGERRPSEIQMADYKDQMLVCSLALPVGFWSTSSEPPPPVSGCVASARSFALANERNNDDCQLDWPAGGGRPAGERRAPAGRGVGRAS